jgi:hypothetical protein
MGWLLNYYWVNWLPGLVWKETRAGLLDNYGLEILRGAGLKELNLISWFVELHYDGLDWEVKG